MFLFRRAAIPILVSGAMFAQSSESDVKLDLANRHLGLSTLTGRDIRRAVYFDSTWQDTRMECCSAWGAFEIESDGSMIGVNGKEMVMLDPDGHRRRAFPKPAFAAHIAWHQESNMLASVSDRDDREWTLQYWPIGSERFTTIESIEKNKNLPPPGNLFPQTTISWSSDGSAITFSKAGEVFVYTLADGKTISISAGTNPAWSPDGNWIAYRDNAGNTFVVSPRDHSSRPLIPNAKILNGIRWSPDSQFVLVAVPGSGADVQSDAELLICRISDGKTIRINPLVGGSTEDRVFWVVEPATSKK